MIILHNNFIKTVPFIHVFSLPSKGTSLRELVTPAGNGCISAVCR